MFLLLSALQKILPTGKYVSQYQYVTQSCYLLGINFTSTSTILQEYFEDITDTTDIRDKETVFFYDRRNKRLM